MTDSIDWLVLDLGGVLVEVASADRTLSRLVSRTDTAKAHLADVLRERFTDAKALADDLTAFDIRAVAS